MHVELSEPQAKWPALFEQEKLRVMDALAVLDVVIEHIGSTSIPSLVAKPVIDLQVGVRSVNEFEAADGIKRLELIGYEYLPQFEGMVPFRRLFTRAMDGTRLNNLHLVATDHPWWRRHLMFRDYLRQVPKAREEYALTKQALALREWTDVNDYAGAKTAVVIKLEEQAFDYFGVPEDERAWIRSSRI